MPLRVREPCIFPFICKMLSKASKRRCVPAHRLFLWNTFLPRFYFTLNRRIMQGFFHFSNRHKLLNGLYIMIQKLSF